MCQWNTSLPTNLFVTMLLCKQVVSYFIYLFFFLLLCCQVISVWFNLIATKNIYVQKKKLWPAAASNPPIQSTGIWVLQSGAATEYLHSYLEVNDWIFCCSANDKNQCTCPAIFSSEQCMNPKGECIVMWKNQRTRALIFVICTTTKYSVINI